MRERLRFDDGWTVHVGDLATPVPRNTAKTGSAGGATNPTVGEGLVFPAPGLLVRLMGEEAGRKAFNQAEQLADEWRPVTLPHDWTVEHDFVPSGKDGPAGGLMELFGGDEGVGAGYLARDTAWYRKVFALPAVDPSDSGRRRSLEFDGVMRDAHVWVNGSFVGSHYSGYTGFGLDVTEFLRYGDEGPNAVLVRCDNHSTEGWWAEGGGIYRHVWLVATDAVHVARHGVFVSTPSVSADGAVVRIETTVANDDAIGAPTVAVEHVVRGPGGEVVATARGDAEVGAQQSSVVVVEVELASPRLWHVDHPDLYTLETTMTSSGGETDRCETPFGIRQIDYRGDGLWLNGERIPIKGVCVHQDFAGVGIALPDRLQEYKVERLKALGANAYRCAHHPPTPELLDACDRLGMLVLDENRRLETNQEGVRDLTELIRRDRNHPSVFMWSLENEELIAVTPMGRRLLARLVALARRLDPTRPTTAAGQFAKGDLGYMGIPDVAGFNYDTTDAAALQAEDPSLLVLSTEDASNVFTRGVYRDDPEAGHCSSFEGASWVERMLKARGIDVDLGSVGGAEGATGSLGYPWRHYLENPSLGGVFLWTGFDYRGEAVPFGWPAVTSSFGLLDLCGFPKDAAWFWQARWRPEPLVHVLPHWSWPGRDGEAQHVEVYTNCDTVELLLNGERLGEQKAEMARVLSWEVTYAPGTLEAVGYRDGREVARARRETTGPAAALLLRADRESYLADGRDVVVVTAEVVDEMGRVVPTACPELTFSVSGAGRFLGAGNGDPASHERYDAPIRSAFNGLAMALAVTATSPGDVVVRVASPGLEGAELFARVAEADLGPDGVHGGG